MSRSQFPPRYIALFVVYYTKQVVSSNASLARNHAGVLLPNHTVHKVMVSEGGTRTWTIRAPPFWLVAKGNQKDPR